MAENELGVGGISYSTRQLPAGWQPDRYIELRAALTSRALTDAELAEVASIGLSLVTRNQESYNRTEKWQELQTLLAVQACLRSGSATSVDAVDPIATNPGTLTTRDSSSSTFSVWAGAASGPPPEHQP